MTFIDPAEAANIRGNLTSDLSLLGRIYKSRRNDFYLKNVDHNLVEDMLKHGWEEYAAPLKTKTKLRKRKSHDRKFEDDVWCQLYDLGYRHLNIDENFKLPFGKNAGEKKQIDVIAINDDSILLIECKSAAKPSQPPSYKTEFEGLSLRLDGFNKSLEQVFGKSRKIKYIFATRNIRLSDTSSDIERLLSTNSFFFNDNTYDYINSLISTYKDAAHYQFLAMLFKGAIINKDKIELPAIQGRMGKKTYYMFSIEPSLLLKLGFILHRTAANESEMPTYQRLLVPSRLKGIRNFINGGGYFPNSIILNFSNGRHRPIFDASSRNEDSASRYGTLKIPNSYAIAYIIDGQHRVYGYAGTDFKDSNTIPVVAFEGLESIEQLEMFMDINQNQKAVSPTLRITLEEDLYWGSDRADTRIRALRSSIIQKLSSSMNGPLYNKISIGEDKAILSAAPFSAVLSKSSLLPSAKGNKYEAAKSVYALYDIHNHNHQKEMATARDSLVKFLNLCYGHVEQQFPDIFDQDQGFIVSNRGTFAFISLVSSLNEFETDRQTVSLKTKPEDRFSAIEKYVTAFLQGISDLSDDERETLKTALGSGAENTWFRRFQQIVKNRFPEYHPEALLDWEERQDEKLQTTGRATSIEIEKFIKREVLSGLKDMFGENWDIEIGSIQRACASRAGEEAERRYKENLGREEIPWTDMFTIMDYKTIIEKYWTKTPENASEAFRTFENIFALNIGFGFNSKSDKIKWLSVFNSHRNTLAHEGTKDKGLNKEEVEFLADLRECLIGS